MILVLLSAGILAGGAAALATLLAGHGILLALLAYALCGALALVTAAVALASGMTPAAGAAREPAAAGMRQGFAGSALGESQA